MTRQRIERYRKLRGDIVMLDERLADAEDGGVEYLSDTVQASDDGPAFAKRCISVKGYSTRAIPRLKAIRAKKAAECEAIEQYIESLEDTDMFQLLTRRYLEGRNLKEAAKLSGYSEQHASRLFTEFFKKIQKDAM